MEVDSSVESDSKPTASDTSLNLNQSVTRRRALQTGAAVGLMAAGISTPAAAQSEMSITFDDPLAHESRLEAVVEIAELDLSSMSRYDYVDDSGDETSLSGDGWSERTREDVDEDVDPTPHNPDGYIPSNIQNEDELAGFPRGVTSEDEDDDEYDVSALDADEWDDDGGILSNSGDYELEISGTGSAETATFSHEDFAITSGEGRKTLQLIVDVETLASGDYVHLTVVSAEDNVTVEIDPDGDLATDAVVANSEADGVVYQMDLGDLASDLDSIDELQIETDGSPVVELAGLNLDSESKWDLGTQESLDEDDEIETETIEQHDGGWLWITSISTLGDRLSGGTIEDIQHEVEQWGSDLTGDSQLAISDESPSGYDRTERLTQGMTHLMPSAYDLSWSDSELYLVGGVPSSRYIDLGYETNVDETPEDQEDLLDLDLIDVSDQVSIGDDEISLTTSVLSGEESTVVADIVLDEEELEQIQQTGFDGGAGGSTSGGFFSGARGWIVGIAAVVGGYLGLRNGED